jgi:hypothetical protein
VKLQIHVLCLLRSADKDSWRGHDLVKRYQFLVLTCCVSEIKTNIISSRYRFSGCFAQQTRIPCEATI